MGHFYHHLKLLGLIDTTFMMPYPCINMNPIFTNDIGQQSIYRENKLSKIATELLFDLCVLFNCF